MPVVAEFEIAEGGEDYGLAGGCVELREEIVVLHGFEELALVVFGIFGGEVSGFVVEDGAFHDEDAALTPLADGHFVDEVAFGEVAGFEVGAGGFDERAEKAGTLEGYGYEGEVGLAGF